MVLTKSRRSSSARLRLASSTRTWTRRSRFITLVLAFIAARWTASVRIPPFLRKDATNPLPLTAAMEDGPDADLVGFALGVLQEGIEATKKGAFK